MDIFSLALLIVVGFVLYSFMKDDSGVSKSSDGKTWIGTISEHDPNKKPDPNAQTHFTDPPGTPPPAPGHGININIGNPDPNSDVRPKPPSFPSYSPPSLHDSVIGTDPDPQKPHPPSLVDGRTIYRNGRLP